MMKSEKMSKKDKYRWIRPYVAIVLTIAVILLSYSCLIVVQIKKDVDSNNRRFAEYYSTSLENSLRSLQDYTSTLLYNNSAENLQSFTAETIRNKTALSLSYDLIYDIRDFATSNGYVDDIYIYYPASDHVIGMNGAFSSYNYFKTEHVSILPQYDEYRQWMDKLFSNQKQGFYINVESGNNGNIYFYRELPYGQDLLDQRIIVAKVSRELLNNSFHKLMASANYQYAALVDSDGVVYGEAGDGDVFKSEDGRFNMDVSNDRYVCYQVISEAWPLSFVSVQDYGVAYRTVNSVSWILGLGMIIALSVAALISLHYASKNKKAVEKIVDRFEGNPVKDKHSDFDFIGAEIDKLFLMNKQAMEAADRQQKIISTFFLQELLQKENCTEKDIDMISSMYDISLENQLFSLVAAWPVGEERINRADLLRFITDNSDDEFVVIWAQINEIEVFLCNYECNTKSPQGAVLDFAKKMRAMQNGTYQIQISPVMQSSTEISQVWKNMLEQIKPGTQTGGQLPVQKDDMLMREFCTAIDNEDLTTAIKLVPKLKQKLLVIRNENVALCRKYKLIEKLYESFPTEAMHLQIDALMKNINSTGWDMQLITLLQSVDQDINQSVDMRHVAEIAKDIIQQEYNNPQLSLHMISERIGISQSHLSKMFKQKYGVGIIQYLNQCRIEQAKKLMIQGNDNLKVIALSVGFLSDVNLIRVFKKYENTTPGNFRSNLEW